MRSSSSLSPGSGLVLLIGSQTDRPGELPWPALAALSAADAILHDGGVDPRTLGLVPNGRLVERTPAVAARARKLAQEGWRVVWLMAEDPARSPETLAAATCLTAAGVAVGTITGFSPSRSAAVGEVPTPQPYATPLNGLAG